jgi:hypothetical protein
MIVSFHQRCRDRHPQGVSDGGAFRGWATGATGIGSAMLVAAWTGITMNGNAEPSYEISRVFNGTGVLRVLAVEPGP